MNVWSAHKAITGLVLAAAAVAVSPASALTPTPSNTPESTTPVPVGTPWPAPQGVALIGYAILLDDDNFPLPPDKQTWFAGLRWDVLDGFSGSFEVQRAPRPSAGQIPDWGPVEASIPATAAVGGVIEFEQQIPVFSLFCYRVRTVINAETGPYSEPVCMPVPPSSGGSGTVTQVPLPPDVGNVGPAQGGWHHPGIVPSVFALLLGLFVASMVGVSRRGQRL